MTVTLREAHDIVDAVVKKAEAEGLKVGVAVVNDKGGTVLQVGMDGTRPFTSDTARGKALGTVLWGMPGVTLAGREASSVFQYVNHIYGDRVIYAEGSALLKRGDEVMGAVGVSGAAPAKDEELAAQAAAGFGV
ncbi:MAG: heme-binding protein [Dehalococcoidia bacterium]